MTTDRNIHLGDGADVALELGTARIVMLGKSGAGKSNAGSVVVEELVGAGITTVVIDPLGNMHGLRAAGTGDGLAIAIVGGTHGDVPFDPARTNELADLVAGGLSVVVDVSTIDRDDAMDFVAAFLPALTRAVQRTRRNVHVVLEEAETFAPNVPRGKPHAAVRAAACVFARTARNFGIGWTFSTQRPQILAKEITDSATIFVAMRMTGELAQDAIGGEVRSRHGKTLANTVIADAPKLARGEAWIVADDDAFGDATPEPFRMRFRWRHTFDSTRPPKIGEQAVEERTVAAIDLDLLRAALAPPAVEEDDARDEKLQVAVPTRIERVEVPTLSEVDFGHLNDLAAKFRADLYNLAQQLAPEFEAFNAALASASERMNAVNFNDLRERAPAVYEIADQVARSESAPRKKSAPSVAPAVADSSTPAAVGSGPRALVAAIASLPGRVGTKEQVGFIAGYAPSGGTFAKYLSTARTQGWIVGAPHALAVTPVGIAMLGDDVPPPATSKAIVAMWRGRLEKGPRAIFDVLVDAHPKPVPAVTIGERTGYESTGGTFAKYVSTLCTLGLASRLGKAGIVAAAALFPTGRPR